jgi:hypothetical protein
MADAKNNPSDIETRQERRAKRLRKQKARMPMHGKSLAQTYKQVIEKKVKGK